MSIAMKPDWEAFGRASYEREISAEEIREAFSLPKNARIKFHVPGGGDWSNTDIDISAKDPIIATWEEVREES